MNGIQHQPAALELRAVSRSFGALRAIDDVSFSVEAGQRYAVLGSNGAGKTTLFNAITGDVPASSGEISLYGEQITHSSVQHRIRRGLRRTYQSSLLFRDLSVRDNLYLAVRGISAQRYSGRRTAADHPSERSTDRLLNLCHMGPWRNAPVSSLSHGQQRQLEIGMALAGEPRLILFDEPAAGLSPAERGELTDLLLALPRSLAFVIIEHDLDIALTVADHVTVMHNGKVLCHGSPGEIEANPEVQAIYMGSHHGQPS